ncbi:MAG: cupin domain-containing protein [Actinomycetota bacterium]|nr:cupin domain-containing protein [Actinomycetota bacterium]
MRRRKQLHDPLTGQHLTFLLTGRDTAGELLRAEVRLDPGGWVPLHAHARQDERVEVLAGTLTVRVGGKERKLDVSDSADVPRRKLHVLRNAGQGEARFLLEVRPARRMEAAMRCAFGVTRLLRPLARLGKRPGGAEDTR